MTRRKRAFLEDDLDSSDDPEENDLDDEGFEYMDPDVRAERSLFENPYQHNKRRRVDLDDDEDEGFGGQRPKQEKRLHFTQAPSFVTGEKRSMELKQEGGGEDEDEGEQEEEGEEGRKEGEEEGEEGEDEEGEGEEGEEEPGEEEPLVGGSASETRVFGETEDREPRMGGGGFVSAAPQFESASMHSRGGIGSGRTGLSSTHQGSEQANISAPEIAISSFPSRQGIGSKKSGIGLGTSSSDASTLRHPQRSFVRDGTGSAGSSASGLGTPKLSQEEKIHFSKIQGSLGAKLMAKMGWQAGTGLGASGEGIVTPVETKVRPKASMGLAFQGFKEKTAQSKAEAKRRGENASEDEDDSTPLGRRSKGNGAHKPQSDAWTRPRKTKLRVEHQTYEQIVQNAGQEAQTTGLGKIYDATSGEMREISSLTDITSASWTPSTDAMRIPEVRHNLRLIVDVAKGDLDGLAREAKALEARKKWVHTEDTRLRREIQEEAELLARLQNVHLIVDDIKAQSQLSDSDYEPSLEAFSPHIEKLVTRFKTEYDAHGLDEIVVGAISLVVRHSLASWQPLQDPTLLAGVFHRWRHALKISAAEENAELEIDAHGARTLKSKPSVQDVAMTPYESLLWNAWLPKVRSCINNEWSPLDPDPAVQLYEAWSNILPPFIRDNLLDQVLLPKIQKWIADWQPRADGPALQTIVFPWLPHVALRIEEFLGEAKRKVKSLLRTWTVHDGLPEDLIAWKDVFGNSDWDAMMLKYVIPKLGVTLREDFKVNPRQQDMAPLELVWPWRSFLRPSVFSQLLETEFFPKWLDVLHIWLIQPSASYEEVAQWYAFWKSIFPHDVLDLPGIAHGFTCGLQLMNKAIELGPGGSAKLPRPDYSVPTRTTNGSRQGIPKARPAPARAVEVTFRSIVEEFAASHDLLFIPTGRAHEKSRMPLFRVTPSVDGKGGVQVYILDDAVWASDGDDYRAISLEEMVLKANKSR